MIVEADINTVVTLIVLILSGINLIMTLRLKNSKLESQLDLAKMEKELLEIINGKYLRMSQAERLERDIVRRIRSLEHEIHGSNGLRKKIGELWNLVHAK